MKRLMLIGFVLCSMLVGFASPANAQMVKVEKKETSSSKKGWLGVSIQDITSEMKKAMELKSREGAVVSEVVKKSPADSAGIKEKDVIVQFDGQTISDASELQKAVADTKPGTRVSVVVLRKGEKKTIDVVVGKQRASRNIMITSPRAVSPMFEMFSGARNTQGMALRQLNDQLAKYFDVAEGAGVLVWEVGKGSAAEKAGINAGDVITVIGKKKIKALRDVSRALGIYDEGEKAEIEIVRKGTRKTVTLEIEEGNDGEGNQYWFNEGPFRNRNESMLFNVPDIDVQVPEIDVETEHPDLDHLKIEMNNLREHLKNQSMELREKIQREVKPHISVQISRTI
ncbi:MAG: PDZ domain-containing protein [Ignavibacteriales bacterium]|nr:PDZ domain-containing protein [Ignavibacteriales bacterium]